MPTTPAISPGIRRSSELQADINASYHSHSRNQNGASSFNAFCHMRSRLDVDLLSTSSFTSENSLAGPFRYSVQNTARCDFRDSLLAILRIILNKHPRPGIQRTPDEIFDDCLSRAVVYCNAYRSSEGDEELWNSSTLLDGHLQE